MSTKRKYRNGSRLNIKRIMLLLGILCFIIVGIVFLILKNRPLVLATTELPISAECDYKYTGSGFLYAEGGYLKYYDINSAKNNYNVQLSSQTVRTAGAGLLHCYYYEKTLNIVGNTTPIEFPGVIIDVQCSKSHIAVHERYDNYDIIHVYNAAGEKTDEITFGNKYLSQFGFAETGESETLYSVAVDTSALSPVTSITTYSVSPPATTGIITVINQLTDKVIFTESSIFVVGSTSIIRYARDGNYESYRLKSYGYDVDDFSSSDNVGTFILSPQSAKGSFIRVCRANEATVAEENIQSVQLSDDIIASFTAQGFAFAVSPGKIYKYNSSGKVILSEDLSRHADAITKLEDNRFLISSGGKLYLVKFFPDAK